MRAEVFWLIVLSQHYVVPGVNKLDLDNDGLHAQVLEPYDERQRGIRILALRRLLSLAVAGARCARRPRQRYLGESPSVDDALISNLCVPIRVLIWQDDSVRNLILPEHQSISYGCPLIALPQMVPDLLEIVLHLPLLESRPHEFSRRWEDILLPVEEKLEGCLLLILLGDRFGKSLEV